MERLHSRVRVVRVVAAVPGAVVLGALLVGGASLFSRPAVWPGPSRLVPGVGLPTVVVDAAGTRGSETSISGPTTECDDRLREDRRRLAMASEARNAA